MKKMESQSAFLSAGALSSMKGGATVWKEASPTPLRAWGERIRRRRRWPRRAPNHAGKHQDVVVRGKARQHDGAHPHTEAQEHQAEGRVGVDEVAKRQ